MNRKSKFAIFIITACLTAGTLTATIGKHNNCTQYKQWQQHNSGCKQNQPHTASNNNSMQTQ